MNQLQPIFNNELNHNQKYIHSATAPSDYVQQLVPAAFLRTQILSLVFFLVFFLVLALEKNPIFRAVDLACCGTECKN